MAAVLIGEVVVVGAPAAIAAAKACAANLVCLNKAGIAAGEIAAGDALGASTLVVGAAAVAKSGDIARSVGKLAANIEDLVPKRTFKTKIDHNLVDADHVVLPEGIAKTFKNSEYATVTTSADVSVYRKFGGGDGQAKANGGFAGTERNLGRDEIAVYPRWNTTQFEAEIVIPKGTQIHVGKVAEQPVRATSPKYRGGADQVLLPRDYPDTWIKSIRDGKTGRNYSLNELKKLYPDQFHW
jgi:filamentous hemagglutinin